MQPETKKLGALLIEAGMITPAQLQETLRQQRLTGGRLGSTLVSQGIISEESLLDFLARQTGVPRIEPKGLEIAPAVLQRIPRRLAEQLTILPVSFKEPKSLVLAMADPLDLNAIDSARFASGLNIEPVVAGHTALRLAISEQYSRTGGAPPAAPATIEVGLRPAPGEGLPVPFALAVTPFELATGPGGLVRDYPKDPFFEPPEQAVAPFSFFSDSSLPGEPGTMPHNPDETQPGIIPQRSAMAGKVRPIDEYGTRALLLGLIRLLQRRGIFAQDELQRLLDNLIESREIDPDK